jgi:hypothetical protein
MSNPFATEKAWDLSSAGGDLLPVGDHKCTILSAEDDTSSGGYPQVVLEVGNEQGQTRKDWLTITQNSVGRIVGLVELLPGVERPSDNDVGPDLRLSQKYLNTWAGQPIGVLVRDKPKHNDPSDIKPAIVGYVSASAIDSDLPPQAAEGPSQSTLGDSGEAAGPGHDTNADEKIPF